ncbi:nucleoside triphosphate pyrophosphohydrolase [Tropicimonas sp. IMCC34011]|uniref:nucleoside triphosphate pyrophosphohydrolase n=1 Tax=Tropicimonas sp. IMCC34011 TaxID=2248759 RepID=UPI000E241B12|nr:nucleoside triphosphate pyrophosphohydrolase [Tropicimonas sp. IMCC34011]
MIDPDTLPAEPLPRLLAVMAALRDPADGCPWDLEQTWSTIAPYTIEEAYEVADAIARSAWNEVPGELGDLLLQVVYFAQMGREEERFDFGDIARIAAEKMILRHPHVFGTEQIADEAAQNAAWEVQKANERRARGETRVLDGVAIALPALSRALKLQNRAARVGFDWPDEAGVLDKIVEEAGELAEVARDGDADRIEDEAGDLLFAVVNLVRKLGVDPEAALRRTNTKFQRRFAAVEDELGARGRAPAQSDLLEMDAIWAEVKAREKSD